MTEHGALVDRERELDRIRRAVRVLDLHHRSDVLTLAGRRGAGLSALLDAAVADARAAGIVVALARCTPAEAALTHGVVSQLAAQLRGAGHPLPMRALRSPGSAAVPGLCAEFLALARRYPLLLAVDDVQWADPESRRWLAALAGRRGQAPLLLVQTSAEERPGARREVLPVRPLTERGVRLLIGSTCVGPADPTFVAGATAVTGGSPAVLRVVLSRFAELELSPVPENLPALADHAARVVGDRAAPVIDRLPADALALVRAMAVCTNTVDFDLVASLAAPRERAVSDSLALLVRLGLVDAGDRPVLAPAVAAGVLAGMPQADRSDLTRRAAELAHRAAVPDDRLVELIAQAPPIGAVWAVAALRRVARRRPSAAPTLLARALRENVPAESPRLRVELALAETVAHPRTSAGRLAQVLLDASQDTPPHHLLRAADLLQSTGDPAAARAIAACRRTDVPALAAIGWLAANDNATETVPVPDETGGDPVLAGVAAWRLAMRGRRRARARELATAAFRTAGPDEPFGPRILACRVLRCTGDLTDALLRLDDVVLDAHRAGARVPGALALLERARCELVRGNPARAGEDLAAARAELPSHAWHPRHLAQLVALEASRHLAAGDADESARVLATDLPDGAADGTAWAFHRYANGCLRLALADPTGALPYFHECGRILTVRRWTSPAVCAWRSMAAIAHAARGEPEPAAALAREALARARRWGAPMVCGEVHLLAARVGVDPLPQLTAAVALFHGSPARQHHAVAVADLNRARRASGSVARLPAEDDRVAVLAAAGRSNAQIARLLSTSTRTVESRLTGIYRALGVAGRRELAELFRLPDIVG